MLHLFHMNLYRFVEGSPDSQALHGICHFSEGFDGLVWMYVLPDMDLRLPEMLAGSIFFA